MRHRKESNMAEQDDDIFLIEDEEEDRLKITIASIITEYYDNADEWNPDDLADMIIEGLEEMDFIVTDVLDH